MDFDNFKKNCISKLNKDLFPKITNEFCELMNKDEYNNIDAKQVLPKIIAAVISKTLEEASTITMYQIQEYHQWLLQYLDLPTSKE